MIIRALSLILLSFILLLACEKDEKQKRNIRTLESYLIHNNQALHGQQFFRPQEALVWTGEQSVEQLEEKQAQKLPFPPFQWAGMEFPENQNQEVWYQFEIPQNHIPASLGAIFITRVYLNVEVYLNGKLIGSGGSMEDPIAKNAHRPLYFTIPEDAWQKSNLFQIRHRSYPEMGYLIDVLIAEDKVLRPFYQSEQLKRQEIPKALFVIQLIAALILFYIWFSQRDYTYYFWFSLSMCMLSVFTLNQFLVDTYVNHKIWLTLNNTSLDWWGISLILFSLQKLKIDSKAFQNTLLTYGAICFIYYLYLPLNRLPGTTALHGLTMLLMLINIVYIYTRKNGKEAHLYIIFFISILLFALHDILMQAGLWSRQWLNGGFILFYAAPLACLLIFSFVIKEFVAAMRATQHHAEDLQMHINLTRQELEEQYAKLQSIAENKAIENERERIYRDLHDDVGAKLLSLYYRSENIHSESLAKSALEDLRDIVSRKHYNGETLQNAITQWQKECEERTNDYGIKLVWDCNIQNNQIQLNEAQFTHSKRMLREAISNALRHNPDISFIRIHLQVKNHCLEISVENDGSNAQLNNWQHGRGLNNLSFRANEMQGSIELHQLDEEIVSLTWRIPL